MTALRRLRKTDNNRLARVTGATIVSRAEEIKESDVGTLCGLFEIEKIGDELRFSCSLSFVLFWCIFSWASSVLFLIVFLSFLDLSLSKTI